MIISKKVKKGFNILLLLILGYMTLAWISATCANPGCIFPIVVGVLLFLGIKKCWKNYKILSKNICKEV